MPEHGTQFLSNHYCAAKLDGVGPQGQESRSNLVRVAQDHLAAPNGSTKLHYVSRVVKIQQKVFPIFDRGLQKYARNLIFTMAF